MKLNERCVYKCLYENALDLIVFSAFLTGNMSDWMSDSPLSTTGCWEHHSLASGNKKHCSHEDLDESCRVFSTKAASDRPHAEACQIGCEDVSQKAECGMEDDLYFVERSNSYTNFFWNITNKNMYLFWATTHFHLNFWHISHVEWLQVCNVTLVSLLKKKCVHLFYQHPQEHDALGKETMPMSSLAADPDIKGLWASMASFKHKGRNLSMSHSNNWTYLQWL